MNFTLERTVEPEVEPVTLAEMKRHLRAFEEVTDEDTDIPGLITAAREWAENYTGRALIDQTWRLTIDRFASNYLSGDAVGGYRGPGAAIRPGYYEGAFYSLKGGEILLQRSPILAIASFVSVDTSGAETAIDAATYALREADSKWPRIVPLNGATWGTGTLKITFRAGFADRDVSPQQAGEAVPLRFHQAIKIYAEALYARDPKTMELYLDTAQRLLKPENANLGFA